MPIQPRAPIEGREVCLVYGAVKGVYVEGARSR